MYYIWLVVWNILCFRNIWDVILPIDFHIFQRGRYTTNQHTYIYIYICMYVYIMYICIHIHRNLQRSHVRVISSPLKLRLSRVHRCCAGDAIEGRPVGFIQVGLKTVGKSRENGKVTIFNGKIHYFYGKSPFLIGNSTVSMAIFNSYFDITRG